MRYVKPEKMGEEHQVTMTLKMKSVNESEDSKGRVGFEVRKVSCDKNK